jgi:RTX calcium-binding nonapeptide repeat (4 copies)
VAVLLVACALLLLAPAAHAGTAALQGTELDYRADSGERNRVSVTFQTDGVEVVDSAGVRPGRGCTAITRRRVSCARPEPRIEKVVLTLADRDDRARVGPSLQGSLETEIDGGSGDDVLVSRASFRDVFTGGPGDDTMSGAAYAVFDEGRRPNGHDSMRTRPARRRTWGWVDYGARTEPIHADLDGRRDDGERGERDLLGRGVTSIRGGDGADRLSGDAADNWLIGGGGRDVLVGATGDDALIATVAGSRDPGVGVPESPTTDRLAGGPGEDLLEGSTGANALHGGPGPDRIVGLAGADRIRAVDGQVVDQVECGPDSDRVWNDVIDFRADCESALAFPPGAVPVTAWTFFDENRYPGDPPSRWVALVRVACSVRSPCSGAVDVLLDGEVAATAPFKIDAPRLYGEVAVSIPPDVAALIRRRDARVSVAVTVTATGVRREAGLAQLGRRTPLVPHPPLPSG